MVCIRESGVASLSRVILSCDDHPHCAVRSVPRSHESQGTWRPSGGHRFWRLLLAENQGQNWFQKFEWSLIPADIMAEMKRLMDSTPASSTPKAAPAPIGTPAKGLTSPTTPQRPQGAGAPRPQVNMSFIQPDGRSMNGGNVACAEVSNAGGVCQSRILLTFSVSYVFTDLLRIDSLDMMTLVHSRRRRVRAQQPTNNHLVRP
jgi:hypothetical protein